MKDFIKRILVRASLCFTALTFSYALIIFLIYGGTEDGGLLSSLRTVMFFFFSGLLAASAELLRAPERRGLMLLLHAIITGAGFYLFMILPAGIRGTASLSGIFIYYLVYAALISIFLSIRARTEKKQNRDKEYHSIFKED